MEDDSGDADLDQDYEPEEVEAVVGSLLEGGNLQLVVESVETTTEISEFRAADPGNEFTIIQLAMKNVTDEFSHVF